MDALLAAIVALGVVAALAVVTAGACIWVLSNAAKERRDAILRAEVVGRVSELADEPEQLLPAFEAVRPIVVSKPGKPSKAAAVANGRERAAMASAHLNPEDPEEVEIYRAMAAMELNPMNPEDVAYFNELGEM